MCEVKGKGQEVAAQVLENNEDCVNTIPVSLSVSRCPVLWSNQ